MIGSTLGWNHFVLGIIATYIMMTIRKQRQCANTKNTFPLIVGKLLKALACVIDVVITSCSCYFRSSSVRSSLLGIFGAKLGVIQSWVFGVWGLRNICTQRTNKRTTLAIFSMHINERGALWSRVKARAASWASTCMQGSPKSVLKIFFQVGLIENCGRGNNIINSKGNTSG